MTRLRWSSALLTGALLIGPAGVAAQADVTPGPFWVTVGLGAGLFSGKGDNDAAFTGVGRLTYHSDEKLFSLRGATMAELFGDGVGDVAAMFGRAWFGPTSHTSVSGGPALVYFEDCPDGLFSSGPCVTGTSVGLALSAVATWRPAGVVGLGVEALANLNGSHSFGALVFLLEVGALY